MLNLRQNAIPLTFLALLFVIYILYNSQSKTNFSLLFLFLARLLNPIIDGFTFSRELKVFLGAANTIVTVIFIFLAVLAIITSPKARKWESHDRTVLTGLYLIGICYLLWKIFRGAPIITSDLSYIATLTCFLLARPTDSQLYLISKVAIIILSFVMVCALLKYQNPYSPVYPPEFGMDGPYHNFVWNLFDHTERFRGPYATPNVLAYNVVFLFVLASRSRTLMKSYAAIISLLILLLSGSRTSLLAFSIYYVVHMYLVLSWKKVEKITNTTEITIKKRKIFKVLIAQLSLASIILIYFVSLNPTLNGRTSNYKEVIGRLKENYIFGNGVSIGLDINNAENTYISVLSWYGLFGLLALVLLTAGTTMLYRQSNLNFKFNFIPVIVVFIVASLGESLILGGTYDVGLLYFMLILAMRK